MLFDRFWGMFSSDLGIDLGTANTLISVKGEGILLNEPSVVAVKKGTNRVLMNGDAVGYAAKDMLGKTPDSIEAIRPMKDGVIADFDITEAMLTYFIRKVHPRSWFRPRARPRVVIAVPAGITAVEKRAVYNSAERAGARRVYLIKEPRAAGIGAGLPIEEPTAQMVVDVGGGTTEIAVLSLADMVASESLRVAGDDMDDAIIAHLKRHHSLLIGEQTAERIKMQIGSAYPLEEELETEVRGRDAVTGLPRSVIISSEEIRESLREPVHAITSAIRSVLERTPPELAGDLVSTGITLAGGGILLKGFDKVIVEELGLPVSIAEDPLACVAKGTSIFLDNLDRFASLLESSDELG